MSARSPQPDEFTVIERGPRNVDHWIVRSSIITELRSVYPQLHGRLLDVGCGRMPYRAEIERSTRVTEYVGLDIASTLGYDQTLRPDVTWDGVTMPFSDASFDCAVATEVFEHVPDLGVLLSEVHRVLRPGGVLFFTTPFLWPYHDTPHDMQRWTSFGLVRQLQLREFHDVKVVSVGNWHSAVAQMLGLWVTRSGLPRVVRGLVRRPVYWLQRVLMQFESTSPDTDNAMPRLLVGTAVK